MSDVKNVWKTMIANHPRISMVLESIIKIRAEEWKDADDERRLALELRTEHFINDYCELFLPNTVPQMYIDIYRSIITSYR